MTTPAGYAEKTDPHYVYTFWNLAGDCLYVGCTVNLARRLNEHQRREWWPEVARLDVTWHDGHDAGRAVEEARIRELDPIHNRRFTTHDTPRHPLSPEMAARKTRNYRASLAYKRRMREQEATDAQPGTPDTGWLAAGERHTAAARVDGARVAAPPHP